MIAINIVQQNDYEVISEIESKKDITYHLLTDPFRDVKKLYNVEEVSTTIMIDRNGIIVDRRVGYMTYDDLVEMSSRLA